MTAAILAFPLNRRVDLIQRQAAWYAAQSRKGAENNLARLLTIQREALISKGVDPATAEKHAERLEAAIRAMAWRYTFDSGEVG